MKKKLGLVFVTLVVVAVAVLALGSIALAAPGDHANVVATYHDVTGGTGNACEGCHTPHAAQGSFLWPTSASTDPNAQANLDDGTINTSSSIKPLCYSCHDGTLTDRGLATAFNSTLANHRTRSATTQKAVSYTDASGVRHPVVNADGTIKLATNADGSPSLYGAGRDCDLCHDPHEVTARKYIRYQRIGSATILNVGGDICSSCHTGDKSTAVGAGGYMTNHKIEATPTALNSPLTAATPLWLPNAGGVWTRSTDATAKLQCMTCHTPHGADKASVEATQNKVYDVTWLPYTGVAGGAPADTKTYTINTMSTVGGGLCLNCHK